MKNMVIIGNGNVAIDVARIFSKKVDELKTTDINEKVLELRNVNPTENVEQPMRTHRFLISF